LGRIRELDYATVVRIAAGEVIDRPASVVRELLDNSLDAEAASVSVHIHDGGKRYIEIRDDGCGMDGEDLAVCWKNHATSKIRNFDDVHELSTLGFRGEALASVAEVAHLAVVSCDGTGPAHRLEVENGKSLSLVEAARDRGTTVTVKDLFRNLPARLKFLGSASAETRQVSREIIRKALAHPAIAFEFHSDGMRKFLSPARKTLLERLNDFFPDATPSLVPVEYSSAEAAVTGYLSRAAFIRPNRGWQYFYVNGRPVEWKNFSFAVSNAYGNLVPKGYHPAVFLMLETEPSRVDVNVHPMKKEVRFQDEQGVARAVRHALRETLVRDHGIAEAEESFVPFTPFERRVGEAIADFSRRNAVESATRENRGSNSGTSSAFSEARPEYDGEPSKNEALCETPGERPDSGVSENIPPSVPASPVEKDLFGLSRGERREKSFLDYRFVGIFFRSFLALEGDDEILLVDQHAAHERITYEKLRGRYRTKLLDGVELLVPVQVDVPAALVDDLSADLDTLRAMGFDAEHFGGNTFIVRSAPPYIDYADIGAVVSGYVETLSEDPDSGAHSADFVDRALKQMACKSSVRGGDAVSREEALHLLSELEETENRFSCPHGRPIVVSMPRREIERQFKRLGF
jgi:DNA mismatch repair protein MutL